MIYFTQPNVDDICKQGKVVSIESCKNCKYCKELHRIIQQGNRKYYTGVYLKVQCDYENN